MRNLLGSTRMMVSLAETKAYLRIEQSEEDAQIECLLLAAQSAAADFCRTTFLAGVPEAVQLAVLLHVGHFYAHREGSDADAHAATMQAFRSLLWPHRDTTQLF